MRNRAETGRPRASHGKARGRAWGGGVTLRRAELSHTPGHHIHVGCRAPFTRPSLVTEAAIAEENVLETNKSGRLTDIPHVSDN